MRRTRVLAATALLAATAMVLAACGSSPGQADDNGGSTSTQQTTDEGATGGETTEGATGGETTEAPPAAGVGEVGGSACGTPHGPYDDPGEPTGTVTPGFNEMAYSLNPNTGHGNSVYNADPVYLLSLGSGLFYYDGDSQLINNDSFGTCTLDSLDPLTVTYHINDGVQWSDGVPVTAADLIMGWVASSGHWNNDEVGYDDDGNLIPAAGIAFDADSPGGKKITAWPTISDDGQTVTFTYSEYYVDYNLEIGVGVPAHVVAMHALGEDDAATATSDMLSLFQDTMGKVDSSTDDQKAQLKAIADFWNTGFDMTSMPDDASLYVGNGAYVLTDWKKDQYMTFEANPNYTWGPKPTVKTIVWTYAPDPTAALQSMQNGDLDIINPQATADIKTSLEGLVDQGIETVAIDGAIYEHVDLVFDNGGPFDPATYGGDADKALKVRQAFLQAIPRQQIVDTLIKPLNPDAVLRQSFMFFPGQPGYDESVAANGSAEYADAGSDAALEKSKALLAEAGVKTPIDVRLLYADNNPRRAQEYQLMADSLSKVGFNLIDGKDAGWGGLLSNNSVYDASLFAWASESTAVSESVPNYMGEGGNDKVGQNNFGHYYNADVNTALNDILVQTDPAKIIEDQIAVDTHLWSDAFGTVLFQFPDIVGYNSNAVTGVTDAPLNPTFLWNYWEWQVQ